MAASIEKKWIAKHKSMLWLWKARMTCCSKIDVILHPLEYGNAGVVEGSGVNSHWLYYNRHTDMLRRRAPAVAGTNVL